MLRSCEPFKDNGSLGCAVIVPGLRTAGEVDGNYLATAPMRGNTATYYAGSVWDRGGQLTSVAEWDALIAREAPRRRSPVVVTVSR